MCRLTDAEDRPALPPNCCELTIITCHRLQPGAATSSFIVVCTDELSAAESKRSEDLKFVYGPDAALSNTSCQNVVLDNMVLSGLVLDGVDFTRCSMQNVASYGSSMRGCNFLMAKLCDSNLSGTDLAGSNFDYANLERTVLNGTKLVGATFNGTYFDGAKSVENALWDPLDWKTKFKWRPPWQVKNSVDRGVDQNSSDDGGYDDDDDDEKEETVGDHLSLAAALRRQQSVASMSDKDKIVTFVKELIHRQDMDFRAVYKALINSGYELPDLVKGLQTNLSNFSNSKNSVVGRDAMEDRCKAMLADFQRRIEQRQKHIFHDKIYTRTINDVDRRLGKWSKIKAFVDHVYRNSQDLHREKNEMRDVMDQLHRLRMPFLGETWVEGVEQWKELNCLQEGMSSQRAVLVLRSVFEDKEILRALGMAEQMKSIRGVPPQGLLLVLKQKLGGHLRKNYFTYKRALDEELNCIEFIEKQKTWVTAMTGSIIVAIMIGFANLVANTLLNKFCSSSHSDFCPKTIARDDGEL